MKWRVDVDGKSFELTFEASGDLVRYSLTSESAADPAVTGSASVVAVSSDVYSVLLEAKSITVNLAQRNGDYEATALGRRFDISLADTRDRSEKRRAAANSGGAEIRAQMPGKIISLLVAVNDEVAAGQSLVVIEAMKMQNELKSPKAGIVSRILVAEGETVPANHKLIVVE